MTPVERLKEIEKRMYLGDITNGKSQHITLENVNWLINRVKRLTEALNNIQVGANGNFACTWRCDITARKALEEE